MSSRWICNQLVTKLIKKKSDLGEERNRKALLTAVMNVLSQVVHLATGLISVPLALNYVGAERFGIWMTLSTALNFITFSDLGVGIGVQDRIARCIGGGDQEGARKAFFTSISFVSLVFLAIVFFSTRFVPNIDIASALSLKSEEAIAEIIPTTLMVIFCLGLGLVSGIVQRAFNSLQEGFWIAVIQAFSRILSLVLLFVVVDIKMGLPSLVFVVGGLSSVVLLVVGLPLLVRRHCWLIPSKFRWADLYSTSVLIDILKVGALGIGAASAVYLINSAASVVMAKKYGAESVADYAVLLKLVSVPSVLLSYLMLPLWPAITEARVKCDNAWIERAYQKCAKLTFGLSIISIIVLLFFGKAIILAWTNRPEVAPSFELLLAVAVYMVAGYWNTLVSVILNGLSKYKGQASYGMVIALVCVIVSLEIPSACPKEAVVWVVSIGFLVRCALMQIEVSKHLRKAR